MWPCSVAGSWRGVLERLPDPPGTLPWRQGLRDQLQQTSNLAAPWLDPAAILPTKGRGAAEKVLAGQPRVLGSFYRPFLSHSLSIKGGCS